MPIQFQCPHCKKFAQIPDSAKGKTWKCNCGTAFVITKGLAAEVDKKLANAVAPPIIASSPEAPDNLALQPALTMRDTAPRYCPNCGRPATRKSKFCGFCGQGSGQTVSPLSNGFQGMRAMRISRSTILKLVCVLVALVVLIVDCVNVRNFVVSTLDYNEKEQDRVQAESDARKQAEDEAVRILEQARIHDAMLVRERKLAGSININVELSGSAFLIKEEDNQNLFDEMLDASRAYYDFNRKANKANNDADAISRANNSRVELLKRNGASINEILKPIHETEDAFDLAIELLNKQKEAGKHVLQLTNKFHGIKRNIVSTTQINPKNNSFVFVGIELGTCYFYVETEHYIILKSTNISNITAPLLVEANCVILK